MKIVGEKIVKTYNIFAGKDMYEETIIADVVFKIVCPEESDPSPHYSTGLDIRFDFDDITSIKPFEKSLQKVEERILKDWDTILCNRNDLAYINNYCDRLKKEFNIKD
jgi:hypothetical protein